MSSFEVSSKWILAGEHSVLRGYRAVALPYRERQLELSFESGGESLIVDPVDSTDVLDRMLQVLREAFKHEEFKSVEFPKLRGRVRVRSSIPEGSGLGSSAAISVAVARWVLEETYQKSASPIQVRDFATRIENIFHGKSSGLDVAVVSANEPIEFQSQKVTLLGIRRLPKFTLHDTGLRSSTRDCVEAVQSKQAQNPQEASRLDLQMDRAAHLARLGLESFELKKVNEALTQLTESINLAQDCFEAWDLVPDSVRELILRLKAQGALAAKVTGAGRGGFVVALWH